MQWQQVSRSHTSYRNPSLCDSKTNPGNSPALGISGPVLVPCPQANIYQQILDGSNGTIWGPGLRQDFEQQGLIGAIGYYRMARLYNGGSLAADGNLEGPCCTPTYVSDIANRLMGWVNGARTTKI